jgi:hypothetical protein
MLACVVPFFEPVFTIPWKIPLDGWVGLSLSLSLLFLSLFVYYVFHSLITTMTIISLDHCAVFWTGGISCQSLHILDNWEDISTHVS